MVYSILLWISALVLTGAGLVGLVIPALPGAPVLFAGLFAAAWAEDFAYVGWRTLTGLGFMALLSYVVDIAATAFGAGRFGASWRAIVGATVGGIAGLFFGLPGIFLGPFFGAVVGELTAWRSLPAAGRAGLGATLGLAMGAAAKLALAVSMIGLFILVRFLAAP